MDAHKDVITVTFDREMTMNCDAKDKIGVIVDGGAPVNPIVLTFHPTDKAILGMQMQTPFAFGQVITWAYNDTGPCFLQEYAAPNTGLENQTFGVSNLIAAPVAPVSGFSSGFSNGF